MLTVRIDTLLRPCGANGCDVIGLQETKRDGTSEIVTFGYHKYFDVDCSGVEDRKSQHEVVLTPMKEIDQKVGKDGFAISCISGRLLTA